MGVSGPGRQGQGWGAAAQRIKLRPHCRTSLFGAANRQESSSYAASCASFAALLVVTDLRGNSEKPAFCGRVYRRMRRCPLSRSGRRSGLEMGQQFVTVAGVAPPEERMQRHREPDAFHFVKHLPGGGDAAESHHLRECLSLRERVLDTFRTTNLDACHDCILGDGVAEPTGQLPSPVGNMLSRNVLRALSLFHSMHRWLVLLDRDDTGTISSRLGEPVHREAWARADVGCVTRHQSRAGTYLKSSDTV